MKKLSEFFRRLDLQDVGVAIAMLVLGILFIAFPEGALKIVCYVCGAVTILWGVVRFCLCFRHSPLRVYELVLSSVMVAVHTSSCSAQFHCGTCYRAFRHYTHRGQRAQNN